MTQQQQILIGDDGTSFAVRLANCLREGGFWAYIRSQQTDNLQEILTKQPPDAVVLQVVHLDDEFFLQTIGLLRGRKIPIAVVLSEATPLLRRQLRMMGVSLCLTKPMYLSEMVQAIRCMLLPGNSPVEMNGMQEKSLEQNVTAMIQRLGIPAHLSGYHYLRDAIVQVCISPQLMQKVTKELYPSVAAHFNTTASRVERSIRNAVEYAWDHGAKTVFTEQFCVTHPLIHGKPTNSEMIAIVADFLRIERYPSERMAE